MASGSVTVYMETHYVLRESDLASCVVVEARTQPKGEGRLIGLWLAVR